jgi:ABC-2 type transport system permease protein
MMARHNLSNVIGFEVKRTLTRASFWIGALTVPVLITAAIGLSVMSSASASDQAQNADLDALTFSYSDASGLIDPAVATALHGTPTDDADQGLADVRAGKADAFFAFPADLTTGTVQLKGADLGLFGNDAYESLARALVRASLVGKVGDPAVAGALVAEPSFEMTAYKDGEATGGTGALLPGLFFLLVFYLLIVTLGNQMLSATLEEKENRVTEMILTTIDASSLLVGKIVSLLIIGVTQMAVIMIPTFVLLRVFPDALPGSLSLSGLVFEPRIMIIGTLMLIAGFMLFTTSLVAVGAAMPTVKDAGGLFSVLVVAVMIPAFILTQIMAQPDALVTQVFTYFPFFAPMTCMLRSAAGNLPLWQAIVSLVIMVIVTGAMFALATRLFRYGSVEYTKKINLKSALRVA